MAERESVESISLVGHPFAPIGMGEHIRCSFRALRSVGVRPRLVDIYGLNEPEPDAREEFKAFMAPTASALNIFHINGDEVDLALATLAYRPGPPEAYNIIYPAWELARYPHEWARQLERFDEIWAPSSFIQQAIEPVVGRPVHTMPLACGVVLSYFLGRRYFAIPEASYVFLFFFDMRSYVSRKNPEAAIAAFRRLVRMRPYSRSTLVLKINGADVAREAFEALKAKLSDLRDRVVLIDRVLTDNEVKNLVRCCDCFVSLHRSEGFGRGLAEAMYLQKPVIATSYSGNMDFSRADTALLVDFELIPVREHEYPHWEGQVWAEPDIDQAACHMVQLVDRPDAGRAIGRKASLLVRTEFSYRAAGVRYLSRLDSLSPMVRNRRCTSDIPMSRDSV